jgi:hypothetical protein
VNLLHYFAVPKGEADIRVVFNGTSCGLNDALWSPNFYLPTAREQLDTDWERLFPSLLCPAVRAT